MSEARIRLVLDGGVGHGTTQAFRTLRRSMDRLGSSTAQVGEAMHRLIQAYYLGVRKPSPLLARHRQRRHK